MNPIIVTTPEELRAIVREAVSSLVPKNESANQADTITLEDALELLRQNGFPTSKAKMYKLTSTGDVPCRRYGNKLVFSRKGLLEWAENRARPKHYHSESTLALARSARRKMKR